MVHTYINSNACQCFIDLQAKAGISPMLYVRTCRSFSWTITLHHTTGGIPFRTIHDSQFRPEVLSVLGGGRKRRIRSALLSSSTGLHQHNLTTGGIPLCTCTSTCVPWLIASSGWDYSPYPCWEAKEGGRNQGDNVSELHPWEQPNMRKPYSLQTHTLYFLTIGMKLLFTYVRT